MQTEMDISEFIQNHYGLCSNERCICINGGWLGKQCRFWQSTWATDFLTLSEWQKKIKEEINDK